MAEKEMSKEMIIKLRAYYHLPESLSDAELVDELSGSLGHDLLKLSDAIAELKTAILSAFRFDKKG